MAEQPAIRRVFTPSIVGFVLCVTVFACFAAYVCTRPMVDLLGFLSDDGFYYLQIARHIAAGDGSTFDGINPTNGYQPLWMLVSVLLAKIFTGKYALVRATLAAEFAFHLLSSYLLVRLLIRPLGCDWAFLAGQLWLVNPFPIYLASSLVEAPIYFCALLFAMDCFLSTVREIRAGAISTKSALFLGLSLALCILARTDAIFFVVMALLVLLVEARRGGIKPDVRLGKLAGLSVMILIVLAPWCAYNLATVHTLTLDSGAMKSLWANASNADLSFGQRVFKGFSFLWSKWLTFASVVAVKGKFAEMPWLPAVYIAIVGAAMWRVRESLKDSELTPLTLWLAATCIITGLVYGTLISDVQRWHYPQPALIMFVVALIWIVRALQSMKIHRGIGLPLAISALVVGMPWLGIINLQSPYPWQRDVYRSQPIFERSIPGTARIGCLNAGIPAYFSDRTIIDLDGLVNHTAVAYWRNRRFDELLQNQQIGYICDEEWSLSRAMSFTPRTFRLLPVQQQPLRGWPTGARYLWRVVWFK